MTPENKINDPKILFSNKKNEFQNRLELKIICSYNGKRGLEVGLNVTCVID